MTDDPRLIRAHIALFQGKPGETKRLVNDFVADHANPDNVRSHPLIQWLEAQSHLRHQERVDALTTLVENTPEENTYRQLAHNFLEDERRYTALLEATNTNQPRRFLGLPLWIWGAMVLLVLAVIIGAIIVLSLNSNSDAQPGAIETTQEATAESSLSPTVTPTPTITPTPTAEQNEPFDILEMNQEIVSYFPVGELFIDAIDDNVQVVLDANENVVEPMPGARFYALLIDFRCGQALCHNVPEADLFLVLETEQGVDLGPIPALTDVTIPNAQIEPGMLGGSVAIGPPARGWLVFEVPNAPEPAVLRVVPRPIIVNQTPTPIATVERALPEN